MPATINVCFMLSSASCTCAAGSAGTLPLPMSAPNDPDKYSRSSAITPAVAGEFGGYPAGTMDFLRERSRNATALISTGVSVGIR